MSFWSRRDGICFLLTFLVAITVYTFSLPTGVTLEDAGELAVAADYLGVPHPPGYPIWTLLAWFFQWIFHFVNIQGYPNPAWAIALMSAFFGSMASALVAVTLRKLCLQLPAQSHEPEPSLSLISLKEAVGGSFALLEFALFMISPATAKLIACLGGFVFLLLLTLQALRPKEIHFNWQKVMPDAATLGHGFTGFVAGTLSWTIAWYWLIQPQLSQVFPLALSGILAWLLITLCCRWILQKALTKPGLSDDLLRSRMDLLIGMAGGLLLAFSPLMWSQSVIVEVYSLNAFFLSALLLLVLWYIHDPQDRILYLTAFLFALGLTNHQSLLFLLFFLISGLAAAQNKSLLKDGLIVLSLSAIGLCLLKARQYHLLNDPEARRFFILLTLPILIYFLTCGCCGGRWFAAKKQLLIMALLGILGLSFHLYMPLASEQNPPMNWANARTVEGFRHSLTRGQYAKFSVADNFKQIGETLTTPPPDPEEGDISQAEINRYYVRRTLFLRMLGAYFFDANWKYAIANQFSWQFPTAADDPTSAPPAERQIPLAFIGLIPLLCFSVFPRKSRGWFISSLVAMFFVSVVFLTIQWPELNHNDLWVKRVQYVQAHVLFAIWMALGAAILTLWLYACLPKRWILTLPSLGICGLFIVFPLHKDACDPRHLEQLGSSNLHGHDFGWQYGFHQLKGANGILLDELARHKDPACLINPWAVAYLQDREFPAAELAKLQTGPFQQPIPYSRFKKQVEQKLDLSKAQQRTLKEAATLAAFRALSPTEQADQLVYLHRPLPNWDYPPEMAQHGIIFGATDPGRFVPTYMIFSAECRQDLFIVTQTALADPTYQTTTRDLYGDRIFVPDLIDGNQAFLDYGNDLRLFNPNAFVSLMGGGNLLSLSGISEVNEINSLLSRQMFERNQGKHRFYMEEAIQMKWMIPHQRPHGLIFSLEAKPYDLTPDDLQNDFEFWKWYEEHLLGTAPDKKRNRYQGDLPARKAFSKLRMAQAWNFYERGHLRQAEAAMDQALRFYPANPEASLRAGDMYMRMTKFDKAEAILDAFAKHDPTNRQLVNFRISLEKLRELNEERLKLEKDMVVNITGNTTLQLLQIYGQFEMKKQEKEMAEILLRLPNLQVNFYIHLAAYMQREENREFYRRAVEKWAEKDPRDPRALIDLAVIALSEERYTDMVRYMVRAIQLDPINSRAQLAADPRLIDIRHWSQFQKLVHP